MNGTLHCIGKPLIIYRSNDERMIILTRFGYLELRDMDSLKFIQGIFCDLEFIRYNSKINILLTDSLEQYRIQNRNNEYVLEKLILEQIMFWIVMLHPKLLEDLWI